MNTSSGNSRSGAAHMGAWLGVVTVVLTLVGWCSVPLFIRHFSHSIDVWTSNGWRYGFSALLWAPVLVWGGLSARRRKLPPGLWRASIVPALFNSLGQIAFAWSFYHVDPTTATFGLRLQIVFVAIGAYLLFPSERRVLKSPQAWAAIAMVLIGISGTIFGSGQARKPDEVWGVVVAVASGLLFASYGLGVRRFMHGFHPVTAFAAISQYTAIVMVVLMLALGHNVLDAARPWDAGRSALNLPAAQFGLLLLSSVIGIALGHVFYYISIARLGVAVSSGVIQIQPFGVAIGSYLLFDERLTPLQVVMGCVAVAGAVLLLFVQWSVSRKARAEAAAVHGTPPLAAPGVHALDDDVVISGASERSMEPGDLDAVPCEPAAPVGAAPGGVAEAGEPGAHPTRRSFDA